MVKELTSRQRFFSYPSSKTDILGRKGENEIITLDPTDDLIEIIEGLQSDQRVVLTSNVYSSRFRDQNQFFKHGPKVWLKPYNTLKEAAEDKTPFWLQREHAFDSLDENVEYSGYGWWHLGRERFPITTSLVDSIEGTKTRTRSLKPESREDIIHINEYEGSELDKDVVLEGKGYLARIHSRTENFWYPVFALRGVPSHDETMYSVTRLFDSDHNCGKSTNKAFHYRDRRTGRKAGKYLDHHVIAAYIKIMQDAQHAVANLRQKYIAELKKIGITEKVQVFYAPQLQMNPFALPTQQIVDFYLKLRTQVTTFVYDPQKGARRHNPLQEAQIEKLLWDYVKRYHNRATFFATKQLRDYDWTPTKDR